MTRLIMGMILLMGASVAGAAPPAFPGAEGFGASATGGRGKDVYFVTNLDDSGPGSLRDALSKGDRTVIFRVSGTIDLKSRLDLRQSNVTIAGQTAPGDGICLRGRELMIVNANNVIVRFLRFRPGDEQKAEHDALSIRGSQNVIIDHCSLSWSTDSLNDVTHESGNVTVQWCILSEPLNESVHVKGAHGYGTGWDGRIIKDEDGTVRGGGGSYHHNLIAHCASRAPRIGYYKLGRGLIDCRNNVIYNSGSSYGGETDDFNYVGNYYRPGPAGRRKPGELFTIWADDARMYVAGNVFEGHDAVTKNNALGVHYRQGTDRDGTPRGMPTAEKCLVAKAFEVAPVHTHNAEEAYQLVLERAGATRPARDTIDQRIVDEVRTRSGKLINTPADVGGWPELKSAPPPVDSDNDGMPDAWESAHGLNPNDPSDGRNPAGDDGYTNLEIYLNELAARP